MRKWFRRLKSTDIIFVVLFSFFRVDSAEISHKDVSGQDRMEDGGTFLFETEVEDMMGLILPLLLFPWLFIVLLDPMRASFSVKRGGCSYLCWLRKVWVLPDDERFGGMLVRYVPVMLVRISVVRRVCCHFCIFWRVVGCL